MTTLKSLSVIISRVATPRMPPKISLGGGEGMKPQMKMDGMDEWMGGWKKYDGCKMANSWPATAVSVSLLAPWVCILTATKSERESGSGSGSGALSAIVTIGLLPLYCRNSALQSPLPPPKQSRNAHNSIFEGYGVLRPHPPQLRARSPFYC